MAVQRDPIHAATNSTLYRSSPANSDAIIADRTTNSRNSPLIHLDSADCAAPAQPTTYIARTPSHSTMTNDSAECIAMKDSLVICISSAEDEDVDISIRNTNGANGETANADASLPVKCQTENCQEIFENWVARLLHEEEILRKPPKKMYNCNECNEKFRRRPMLSGHIKRVHTISTPFPCTIAHCPKKFTSYNGLTSHVNAIHTKEIEFHCTICPHKSYYKYSIRKHMIHLHGVSSNSLICSD